MSEMKFLIFLICLCVVNGQSETDSCVTPDGSTSKCISLSSCRHVSDVFAQATSGGSLNSSMMALLRSYHCGFDSNHKPKVCCPLKPIIEPKVAQARNAENSMQTNSCNFIKCIRLRACKPMLDLINPPITTKLRTLLTSYQCGWYSTQEPKVWCPATISQPPLVTKHVTTPQQPTVVTNHEAISEPPDVTTHRNINLLPKDCGLLGSSDRIIGGNKTALFEYPWMALLSYQTKTGPRFNCGGTILNNKYILTAAHCITNLKSSLIEVRVGEHDIQTPIDCEVDDDDEEICAPPFQNLAIEEIIPHPQYKKKNDPHDIGLLRVTEMDFEQEHIRPVCMPLEKTRNINFTRRYGLVTGWGATETHRSSPLLLKVSVPIIEQPVCMKRYADVAGIAITHRQLCAGGKTISDSCAGDSGGPLHVSGKLNDDTRMIQQGIVSFGPKDCGRGGIPGVYTRVAYYMDWILDNLKV